MKRFGKILAFAIGVAGNSVIAQSIEVLDQVVITASRVEEPRRYITSYIESFSSADIARSGAASVPDFLQRIVGANMRSTNSSSLGILSTTDLRGFGASAKDNTLILLDGQRLNPIDGGSVRWETVPLDIIDRIEILYGSGSVQFGDRAVGGTINIITRKPTTDGANASLSLGSFGRRILSANREVSGDNSHGLLSLSSKYESGWRDNSDASESLIRVKFLHHLGPSTNLDLSTAYSAQRYSSPGGVIGEVNQGNRSAAKFNNVGDRTKVNQTNLAAGFKHLIETGWLIETRLISLQSDQRQVTPFSTTSVKSIQFDKSGESVSFQISKGVSTGIQSVLGLDWSVSDAAYRPNTGDAQNAELEDLSLFFSHKRFLANAWLGTVGARVQRQTAEALDLTQASETRASKRQYGRAFQLGLSYIPEVSAFQKISLNFSRGYRFANTDEFWASAYGPPPTYTQTRVFSGILRPQSSDGVDLVLEAGSARVKTSATFFASRTTDEIRYCVSAQCNFGSNVNSESIERLGTTGRASFYLNPKFEVDLGGTFQETRFSGGEFEGKRVALAPAVLLNTSFNWQVEAAMRATLAFRYVGSQFYEGDESNSLNRMPAYMVTDLRVSKDTGQWSLNAGVNNLFDKRYANFGGYAFVTLSPTSSDFSYYYYPGEPRSVYLSASRRFD